MTEDPFVTHRSVPFTVAYELLGSAADAEDVVQETWADGDRGDMRDPRAYLVRIVTRQALNRLRTVARRRQEYVGEWLPEPLSTSPDVADGVGLDAYKRSLEARTRAGPCAPRVEPQLWKINDHVRDSRACRRTRARHAGTSFPLPIRQGPK